ncbi:interleukin-11 [Ammospiza caudacuta]|uniref:interleukin-11 n=1 Tax=Ammospiza caudacuta TaxID=2857398 RepID=UPI002738D1F2|nr:interleukin-11 [Ammospiza caudacuta]
MTRECRTRGSRAPAPHPTDRTGRVHARGAAGPGQRRPRLKPQTAPAHLPARGHAWGRRAGRERGRGTRGAAQVPPPPPLTQPRIKVSKGRDRTGRAAAPPARSPHPIPGTPKSSPKSRDSPPQISAGAPFRALLTLLGLWPGLWPGPGVALAPRPRPPSPPDPRGDLDSVIHLAKALLGDTRALLELLKSRFPAEGEHKMDSLPVLAMSALELPNIQASSLLPRLGSDLLRYQRLLQPSVSICALSVPSVHLCPPQASSLLPRLGSDLLRYQRLLEWLRRAGAALRGLEPPLGALRGRLERLRGRLEHLVSRLSLPRPAPSPGVTPPPQVTPWGAVRAAHALLRGLHLYLDWAARALVLLRNRL